MTAPRKTTDTVSLDTAQFYYIESRIGWVSALLYYHIQQYVLEIRDRFSDKG